jgi:hypothetical protein
MSEPFETVGRDSPFTEAGLPLADIFSARPAAPQRGQGDADPNVHQRPRSTATENDPGSRNKRSATNGPRAPRLRALRAAASRAQVNRRSTAERFRVAGLAGVERRFARWRLPALARTLIGGALLFVVVAALGLVAGRQSPPREQEPHRTPAPPHAVNPARGGGQAAGSLLRHPRRRTPASKRPTTHPSPGRRATLRAQSRQKPRAVPPGPRQLVPARPAPRLPVPAPPAPRQPVLSPPKRSTEAVAPPRAPGPQRPAPPARRAPALPAPVPPGSPPEFL